MKQQVSQKNTKQAGFWTSLFKKSPKEQKSENKRGYEAGRFNPTKTFWSFTPRPINRDIYDAIRQVRAQSRNLSQNNSVMKKWLTMLETNIPGPDGYHLQVNVPKPNGDLDTDINTAVENAWCKWSKAKYCDITGNMSFKDMQTTGIRGVGRDGEQLTRIIRTKATAQNPFGYQLQTLDPERLDSRYNATLDSGNLVKMGVEVDRYDRPVAYWLRNVGGDPSSPNNTVFAVNFEAQERERVLAKDILFVFDKEEAEQTRGMPWAYAVMTLMADLEDYLRTALIASKVGASSSMYLERDPTKSAQGTEDIADSENDYGDFEMEVAPGKIRTLPTGYKVSAFEGHYPTQNFVDYVQFMLKMIASGLNVSFFILANSFEEVNYTSSRTALLEERDYWKVKQNWYAEKFLEPVFEDWLEQSLLNGAIVTEKGVPVPPSAFDKIVANYKLLSRRWDWVDPLKDTQANMLMIQNGLKSRSQVVAERGGDYEKILQDKVKEQKLEQQYGVSFETHDMYGDNKDMQSNITEDNQNQKPAKPEKQGV